jgi:hypothetical protein
MGLNLYLATIQTSPSVTVAEKLALLATSGLPVILQSLHVDEDANETVLARVWAADSTAVVAGAAALDLILKAPVEQLDPSDGLDVTVDEPDNLNAPITIAADVA